MGLSFTIIGAWILINAILKIKKGKLLTTGLKQFGKKETVWRQIEPFKFYCYLAPQTFVGLTLSIPSLILLVSCFLWYFNFIE